MTDEPGDPAESADPDPRRRVASRTDDEYDDTDESGFDTSGRSDDGDTESGNSNTELEDADTEPGDTDTGSEERDAEPENGETKPDGADERDVPEDVQTYERFTKVDGAEYERVNEFLRNRTHITAREWAIARLCSDFRTETGVEMTKIGENLPELVPFMTDTYTPQAVNQARASFEEKIRMAGATFLYGAMCDFFTAEELDDVMYEATEVAKFLLEVEGVELSVEEELEAEERISTVMREVREASQQLRTAEELELDGSCPHCGEELTDD